MLVGRAQWLTANHVAALAASREAVRLVPSAPPSSERGLVLAGEAQALIAKRARVALGADGQVPPDAAAAERGITPREREVLALLAEGAANREIAETLVITEKTASVHVSHILAKLDARNRSEAASIAHRLGLSHA